MITDRETRSAPTLVPRRFHGTHRLHDGRRPNLHRHSVAKHVIRAEHQARCFRRHKVRASARRALIELFNSGLLQLVSLVSVALVFENLDTATPRGITVTLNNRAVRALTLTGHEHRGRSRGIQRITALRHAAIAVSETDGAGPVAGYTEPQNDPGVLLLDRIKSDTTKPGQGPSFLQQILVPQIRGHSATASLR